MHGVESLIDIDALMPKIDATPFLKSVQMNVPDLQPSDAQPGKPGTP
jgi:hypothetical protein